MALCRLGGFFLVPVFFPFLGVMIEMGKGGRGDRSRKTSVRAHKYFTWPFNAEKLPFNNPTHYVSHITRCISIQLPARIISPPLLTTTHIKPPTPRRTR